MLVFTILVSCLLIGSSVAQSDAERMASLRLVNSSVSTYIITLAKIYDGFGLLEGNTMHMTYLAVDDIIKNAASRMRHNEQNPNNPVQVDLSALQVKTFWQNATLTAINARITDTDTKILANGDDPENVFHRVLEATKRLMHAINGNSEILDEHKRGNCPIYYRLSEIASEYGTPEQYEEFQSKYGTLPSQ